MKMAEQEETTDESDIYSENSREELVEDGEMTPEEEGFMAGFEGDDHKVSCAECKKVIVDRDDAIEAVIDGETLLFCSDECYVNYKHRHEKINET